MEQGIQAVALLLRLLVLRAGRGHLLLARPVDGAGQGGLRPRHLRLLLVELGVDEVRLECDQRLPGLHAVALVGVHGGHAPARERADLHVAGLDGAREDEPLGLAVAEGEERSRRRRHQEEGDHGSGSHAFLARTPRRLRPSAERRRLAGGRMAPAVQTSSRVST